MKKTLTLLSILAAMGMGTSAWADTIWLDGLNNEKDAAKYAYSVSGTVDDSETGAQGDNKMSSVAAVAGILDWWQDSVEKSGAVIVPKDAPRGEEIWTKLSTEWKNRGAQPGHVLQYYLSGDTGYTNNADQWLTQKGLDYAATGGLYPHLQGTHLQLNDWSQIPFSPDSVVQFVDSRGYNSTSTPKAYDDGYTSYAGASENLVKFLKDGCGAVLNGNAIMSLYAVETDEKGCITKVWYHDSRHYEEGKEPATIQSTTVRGETDPNTGRSYMVMEVPKKPCDITEESPETTTTALLTSFSLIRTKGLQFDTYEAVAGKDNTADLFSHYLNLTVDGASDYKLQYDLRDATADGSPVDSKGQHTGDITLQSGKLTLVEGVGEYDGGGSASGTISFGTPGKDGGTRTLTADRSGQIADTIQINASFNNTLEVTDDNKVTFNKLTGEGNLTKTGTGTAEVTQEVTLKGTVTVEAGDFLLPTGVAADSETFQLLVLKDGKVVNKAGEAVTLSLTGGVHTNDGVLALATSVGKDTVMKGSGTFAEMTVDGGTLIVGNSPGRQTYTGDLEVKAGDIVFSVSDWGTAATQDLHGWEVNAYSNLVMNNNALTFGGDAALEFAVGGDALATLLSGEGDFSMEIAAGITNTSYFTSDLLQQLALHTKFYVAKEEGAVITNNDGLSAGADLTKLIYNLEYNFKDDGVLCVSGSFGQQAIPESAPRALSLSGALENQAIPEPTTGTLGLLALAGLCIRRRRK